MLLYGFRLLVALLTFAFGVAASWLLGSGPSKDCKGALGLSDAPVISVKEFVPQSRSCPLEQGRVVERGLLQSKTIDERSPAYPVHAKKVRLGGNVIVKVEVDEDGRVVKAQARSGYGMLPEAAEKDALDTSFAPTLGLSGQPVKVSGYIMYKFVLD